MQRSGRPKRQSRGKQADAELFSTGTETAPQESAPDESQLAVRAYDEFPYESYSFPLTHPERLATDMLQLYAANAVELHSMPSSFVTSVSEQPRTSALVRLQASKGARVTNLRHESLRVNDVERRMLTLLDGSCERREVIEQLAAAVHSGELTLKRGDQPITDPADRLEQLGRFYDQLLPQFGKKALLVA